MARPQQNAAASDQIAPLVPCTFEGYDQRLLSMRRRKRCETYLVPYNGHHRLRQQCDDAHDEATVNGLALHPRNRILKRDYGRGKYEVQQGENGRLHDKDREECVMVGRPGNGRQLPLHRAYRILQTH